MANSEFWEDRMKRIVGVFFCLMAGLLLWWGHTAYKAEIEDVTVLPATITRVEQIDMPGVGPRYFPVVEFEWQGQSQSVRLINNLPADGMYPITSTPDGGKVDGSISAQAMWQNSFSGYGTRIVYFNNPDQICFYRHYALRQQEQKLYLLFVTVALGAGVFFLFWMFALGRRARPLRRRKDGTLKKPGFLAPALLLALCALSVWAVAYYSNPLFNPEWTRVKASLSAIEGNQGVFYAVTHRGLDRVSGNLLPSQWSVGDLTDAYYDAAHNTIHLVPLESLSSLLALVLGLIGALSLCMAGYLADERIYLYRLYRRETRKEQISPAPAKAPASPPTSQKKAPSRQ